MSDTATLDQFPWKEYAGDLMPLCTAKADEFHLLGYGEVTAIEIFECVQSILKGRGPLHQVVDTILSLNVGQFMNYMTINAYKGNLDDGSV